MRFFIFIHIVVLMVAKILLQRTSYKRQFFHWGKALVEVFLIHFSSCYFFLKLDLLAAIVSLKYREDLWFIVKTHLLCKIGAPLEGSLIVTFCNLEQPSLSDF